MSAPGALSPNVWYYGAEAPLSERTTLRAGPLSLVYEAGDLRWIRMGDREVLRRIYVAVRDHNWGTIPGTLTDLRLEAGPDTFQISYTMEHRQGSIDFVWDAHISGGADGTIVFAMDGVARSTFLRNRIGFCVLHPSDACAGQPCTVEHIDGTVEQSVFPRLIAPHHPVREMQAITHAVTEDIWADVRFGGDIFEMEDQRNWTDASFKSFSTPLRLPFPVEIAAGTRIAQSVTLALRGMAPQVAGSPGQPGLTVNIDRDQLVPLPPLGLSRAADASSLSPREVARLRALKLSHLRVDLDLADQAYPGLLRTATAEARQLGTALEVALMLGDDAVQELEVLLVLLYDVQPPVVRWLVFHRNEKSTSASWVQIAREYLRRYEPHVPVGAGTNAYFTELNRGRPDPRRDERGPDLLAYSINPQVHAFDISSMVETLAAQAATVESARAFAAGRPIIISPVTLRPRFNPDATGPAPVLAPGVLPPRVDVRQMSLFGAGWTAGSVKYLAESGVASMTYYETTGWRGVMETEAGCPLPALFHSLPGGVFPLYHLLADLGDYAGDYVAGVTSSDPLVIEGLALHGAQGFRVIIANYTAEPQTVMVCNLDAQVRLHMLDETNVSLAMAEPELYRAETGTVHTTIGGMLEVILLPFALARLDTSVGFEE